MEKKQQVADVASPKVMEGELDEVVRTLEQRTNYDGHPMVKYQGFWCPLIFLRPLLSARKNLKAKDTDIILATMPKSGTTWLMALSFSIAHRHIYPPDRSPLLTCTPHALAPFIELDLYLNQDNPDLDHLPSPRIFSTHAHFHALPDSIHASSSKIIHICRNPLDHFISYHHFSLGIKSGDQDTVPLGLDESFDMFCQGVHPYGPFWDQMLGYWNAHLENPDKVLFLKYEDLKHDIASNVRKIAAFIGCPFTPEEENRGLIEEIARLCSFENLKNMEVNRTGSYRAVVMNSSFFRKGQVGDWANYLTPAMAQRIKKIVDSKLQGSGLTFNI